MTTATKTHQAKYKLLPNIKRPKYNFTHKLITAVSFVFSICLICGITYMIHRKLASVHERNPILKNAFEDNLLVWKHRAEVYADNFINQKERNVSIQEENKDTNIKDSNNIPTNSYKLICYYIMSENNHDDNTIFEKLDADLCTHINIGFFLIQDSQIVIADWHKSILTKFSILKKKNENLKMLMTVGGAGISGFSQMVLNHNNRKISILSAINEFHLDGIDLDWEFPQMELTDSRERQHFTQLLREIRAEINRQSAKKRFLLSVAVAAATNIIDMSYDVDYMNQYVDYINVMTYDYHTYTQLTPFTGFNAPLYNTSKEAGVFLTMNINFTAHYWVQKGMDKSKIVLGLPTYGHSFKLRNPSNHGLQAPASGFGDLGNIGFITYSLACAFVKEPDTFTVFDINSKSPYAFKGYEWISYDNTQSLTYKTEFVKTNNFGGVMIFSLNTDDFTGEYCGAKNSYTTRFSNKTSYQLTHTVKNTLFDDSL